jgi:hypothetical protein
MPDPSVSLDIKRLVPHLKIGSRDVRFGDEWPLFYDLAGGPAGRLIQPERPSDFTNYNRSGHAKIVTFYLLLAINRIAQSV